MKKRIISYISAIAITISTLFITGLSVSAANSSSAQNVDILFTHDIHSYLSSYSIDDGDSIIDIGGMPRLKTLIDDKKATNQDLVLLDAGDIAMGTLYQSLYESEAIELSMLGKLGFIATTFGNHEFDYGTDGFARMLEAAYSKAQQDDSYSLPEYLVCNIDWNDITDNSKLAYDALNKIGLHDYMMIERNGYNIAILGVMGNNAYTDSPRCELNHLDPIESVKATVKKIKENEKADMIICISHSGTSDNPDQSEDELLAAAVPELDVIISGHSHTLLEEPIKCGDTYIVSCKCYTEYAGFASLSPNANGRWNMDEYEAIHMTSDIAEDTSIINDLEQYRKSVDKYYLSDYDYSKDMYIAYNDGIEFETVADLEENHTEQRLGEIIADAYMYYSNNTPSGKEYPIDVTVCPSGTVRGTYLTGPITVANVFESFSLGNGTDGSAGYPLVSIYLTGKELKTMGEIDATVSDLMRAARLYVSGLTISYNPHRLPLNRLSNIQFICTPDLNNPTGDDTIIGDLNDDKLYRVVSDMYTLEMMSAATDMSMGLLSVIPKNQDGTPMNDFNEGILYNEDGTESKAWIAIAEYFESFPTKSYQIDGVNYNLPTIPDYYKYTHGRKIIDDRTSLTALLSHPSKFFYMIIGAVVIIIIVLILIILGLVKLIKHIRTKRLNK